MNTIRAFTHTLTCLALLAAGGLALLHGLTLLAIEWDRATSTPAEQEMFNHG